jgi:hypothetical protein
MKNLCVVPLFFLSLTCLGWGATGHRVTGQVAESLLTKRTKARLEQLLGQSVAMASTWMDEVRSDSAYDYMEDWHWVDVPDGTTYGQTPKNPNGDVIETLDRVIKALKGKNLDPKTEAEYVKILIHLIGDIHQPLHVGKVTDRGGNSVKVSWFGRDTNLHTVWDTYLIDDTKLSYTEFMQSLAMPTDKEVKALQSTSVLDWAKESVSYRSSVYDIGDGRLGYEYTYYHLHIVRKRLLEAGVRLAGVLNEIYGK